MDRTLDRTACLRLLATRSLGRLLFTYQALPDVLPVDYRLEGEHVLVRLTLASPAAAATRNAVVAFQADDIELLSRTGWSVTIVGRAREITDQNPPDGGHPRSWAPDGPSGLFSISAERISGHELITTPPRVQSQEDPDRTHGAA